MLSDASAAQDQAREKLVATESALADAVARGDAKRVITLNADLQIAAAALKVAEGAVAQAREALEVAQSEAQAKEREEHRRLGAYEAFRAASEKDLRAIAEAERALTRITDRASVARAHLVAAGDVPFSDRVPVALVARARGGSAAHVIGALFNPIDWIDPLFAVAKDRDAEFCERVLACGTATPLADTRRAMWPTPAAPAVAPAAEPERPVRFAMTDGIMRVA